MMMAAAQFDDLDNAFDDHPSLTASLEDFEEQPQRSPLFDLPSQHSGFRSEPERGSDDDDHCSSIGAPWSPPGFKRSGARGSAWFRHDPYSSRTQHQLRASLSPSRSRQTSPEYLDAEEGEEDVTLAARIPLPRGGSMSPIKERSPEPEDVRDDRRTFEDDAPNNNPSNYIRFAVRAEVQHREPFMAFFNFLREKIDFMTHTKTSTVLTIVLSLLSLSVFRILLLPPIPPPVPDLVKLSSLAKSFEPLIFYSENGYGQITALQETSVAVWDLGESVRSANMTSAPIIVRSLDELSDSLKTLGLELTRFFTDVDADVDGILIVMDWAKRELAALNCQQNNPLFPGAAIFDHVHGLLNRGGLLETASGTATPLGRLLTSVFGATSPQRTRATLTRTFYEFLNVLEEAINTELTHSAALFALFESIDRQFLNLQRTVVRETDTQERLEADLLASLWTRVMGGSSAAALLRKFEKNKLLLGSVRARTVSNKHLIMEHHGRLQTLKVNLETLRRKLVSPLVRRNDSVALDNNVSVVADQIKGLEATYDYLKAVRERQKSKYMEMVYGAGSQRRSHLVSGVDGIGIEAR